MPNMDTDDARGLSVGDGVEYFDGKQWKWSEVIQPLREAGSHLARETVRVDTGTYSTEAAPYQLRR